MLKGCAWILLLIVSHFRQDQFLNQPTSTKNGRDAVNSELSSSTQTPKLAINEPFLVRSAS